MVKSSPGVTPKPRFGPNLDSTTGFLTFGTVVALIQKCGPMSGVSLYTILSCTILYGVWHKNGGSKGGRTLRNSVACSIATVWAIQVGGGYKRVNPIRAQKSRGKTISCKGQVGLYKIFFPLLLCGQESIIPLSPPPICTPHTTAKLSRNFCAIYDPPPDPPC